jgi:hypothetical protein
VAHLESAVSERVAEAQAEHAAAATALPVQFNSVGRVAELVYVGRGVLDHDCGFESHHAPGGP